MKTRCTVSGPLTITSRRPPSAGALVGGDDQRAGRWSRGRSARTGRAPAAAGSSASTRLELLLDLARRSTGRARPAATQSHGPSVLGRRPRGSSPRIYPFAIATRQSAPLPAAQLRRRTRAAPPRTTARARARATDVGQHGSRQHAERRQHADEQAVAQAQVAVAVLAPGADGADEHDREQRGGLGARAGTRLDEQHQRRARTARRRRRRRGRPRTPAAKPTRAAPIDVDGSI